MRSALLLMVIAALAGCSVEPTPQARPPFYADLAQPGAALDARSADEIINSHRARAGLAPLTADGALREIAEREAGRLARAGIVDDGKSAALDAALRKSGFDPKQIQRGVSGGYHSMADAFSGWRGAPHHQAVLNSKQGRRYGLAAVALAGSRHRVYWVLLVSP